MSDGPKKPHVCDLLQLSPLVSTVTVFPTLATTASEIWSQGIEYVVEIGKIRVLRRQRELRTVNLGSSFIQVVLILITGIVVDSFKDPLF